MQNGTSQDQETSEGNEGKRYGSNCLVSLYNLRKETGNRQHCVRQSVMNPIYQSYVSSSCFHLTFLPFLPPAKSTKSESIEVMDSPEEDRVSGSSHSGAEPDAQGEAERSAEVPSGPVTVNGQGGSQGSSPDTESPVMISVDVCYPLYAHTHTHTHTHNEINA